MAEQVVEADDVIDDLYHQIEDRLLLILATQSPVAADLRGVVTMMRINHELERDADLMVNVAKTTRRIYPHELDPKVRGHHRPDGRAGRRTRPGSRSTRSPTRDPSWAATLADMDDTMDELSKSLFRHILTWGERRRGARSLQAMQVALVARHYERIADHAVTIAERVQFMVTGTHPGEDHDQHLRRSATRRRGRGGLLLVVAEVPVEDQVLALGVARDALAVAPELRVVRREQLEPGQRPLAELVDDAGGRRRRRAPPSAARPGRGTRPGRVRWGGTSSSSSGSWAIGCSSIGAGPGQRSAPVPAATGAASRGRGSADRVRTGPERHRERDLLAPSRSIGTSTLSPGS